MDRQNEREVFDRASDAKAQLNALERYVSSEVAEHKVSEIRKDLEVIARRSDPARHPDYDPDEDDVRPEF